MEVLYYMALGMTNKEIGKTLHLRQYGQDTYREPWQAGGKQQSAA